MMDFINPHAILLSNKNARDINNTTGASYETLTELLRDPETYYIVGWRDETTGFPKWEPLTASEFQEKYGIHNTRLEELYPYLETNFTRVNDRIVNASHV